MRFDYDSTRQDQRFIAIMETAKAVKQSCDKGFCPRCWYHRPGEENRLIVCFCEKLADRLIADGVVK